MKLRQSGMPEEAYWEGLFNVPLILERLGIGPELGDIIELGCGYGTFTLPVARKIKGTVLSVDIEQSMIERTRRRAEAEGIRNISLSLGDVVALGLPAADASRDAVLLFNILHGEQPQQLLKETARVLKPGGWALVIHWNFDAATPRGPSMDIRPKPGQIVEWALETGLLELTGDVIDLPPWHYGIRFQRNHIS